VPHDTVRTGPDQFVVYPDRRHAAPVPPQVNPRPDRKTKTQQGDDRASQPNSQNVRYSSLDEKAGCTSRGVEHPETSQQCEQDPGPLRLLAFHWRPSYPRRDEPVHPEDDPRKGSCQEEGIHVRSPYQVHRSLSTDIEPLE